MNPSEQRMAISGRRASDRMAQLYFSYAITGIIQTDREGLIQQANPAATSICGHEARQLKGMRLQSLFPPRAQSVLLQHWILMQEQGISHIELPLCGRDGQESIIDITSIQIDDSAFMHLLDDVTEQRHASAALEQARQTAEQANQAKSAFLASISHEIRTPLNGILGLSQLALQAELPAETQHQLALILHAGKNLLALVNDLLDTAKIESGKFSIDPHPCQIEDLLQGLDELLASARQNKDVEVFFSIDPHLPAAILADKLRIRQCLQNLIGNAIKFTHAGSITVCIDAFTSAGHNWLRIRVKDTGIGISEAGMAKLFQPFSQADAATARYFGGSGLGLYLTRELAHHMGGELQAQSTPGQGSLFTLLLPLVEAPTPTTLPFTARLSIPQEFRGQRILLAEDDATNHIVASSWLGQAGIDVSIASNGLEAATLAQHPPTPALIFMDVHMPGINGLEATRMLRQQGYTLPIIGLSASACPAEQAECLDAGMNDFLPKPLDPDELWGCLTRWLSPSSTAAVVSWPEQDAPWSIAELNDTFIASHANDGTHLQLLIQQGHRKQAAVIAHTLKSAAALMQLTRASHLALQLEQQLEGGDHDALLCLSRDIQTELDRFTRRFR